MTNWAVVGVARVPLLPVRVKLTVGSGIAGVGSKGVAGEKHGPDTSSSENVVWQFMTTRFLYRGIVQVCQWGGVSMRQCN